MPHTPAASPAAPTIDPLAHERVGDSDPDPYGTGACCMSDNGNYGCTRDAGHPGQHIAVALDDGVVAVWPGDAS